MVDVAMVVRLVMRKMKAPPSEPLSLGLQVDSHIPSQDTNALVSFPWSLRCDKGLLSFRLTMNGTIQLRASWLLGWMAGENDITLLPAFPLSFSSPSPSSK